MLISEKALYTKLEICNILSTGNEMTIKKMIPYVGKIGKNQHHDIAKKVSMKKVILYLEILLLEQWLK